MRSKLAILSLCVVFGLLTIFILADKAGRTIAIPRSQGSMIVTQDGKLTVLAPAPNAMWKCIVITSTRSTNATSPSTNSATP